MLVGVYLDKGRVSDTPESAETVISETQQRPILNINKLTKKTYLVYQYTSKVSSVAPSRSQEEHLLSEEVFSC